ncbi:MAG: hypothetical protein WBA17_07530 [Saprospiraceae bacterium]
MRPLITSFLTLLFLLLAAAPAAAQRYIEYVDQIWTTDGKNYEGQITEYVPGDHAILQLRSGELLTFQAAEIKKIDFRTRKASRAMKPKSDPLASSSYWDKEPKAELPKRHWYHQFSAALTAGREERQLFVGLPGNERELRTITGYSMQYTLGRRFGRKLRVGGGLGYDLYNHDRDEKLVTGLVQARYIFLKKAFSPFVQLESGYGMPVGKNDQVLESRGGPMIHPSLGLKLYSGQGPDMLFGIGYRFQQATYTTQTQIGLEERSNNYRRLYFRLAVVL